LIGFSRDPITVGILRSKGIEAFTCDTLPAEHEHHIQDDVWTVLKDSWDCGIFHPMCTYLTCSAAWAFTDGPYHQKVSDGTLVGEPRREARELALKDFQFLLDLPFPKAVENPAISFVNKRLRPPDQVIQPYQFGEDASKATGLWLDGLPKLKPTQRIKGRFVKGPSGKLLERWSNQTDSGQNRLTPKADRWLERSKTYPGFAKAFAEQWGDYLLERG
jgi:hypothetical protein